MDFSALNPIMSFCNAVVSILASGFTWLINGIVKVIWGVLYVIVDGLLTVVSGFVSLIDLSTVIASLTASWGLLPPTIVWVITQSGLAQCLAIIGYAYLIRMLLNLIPATFTRI
jgi:hypothetical protein